MTPTYEIEMFANAEFVRDPWDVYEEIRSLGPVVYNPADDVWLLTSDRSFRQVWIDHEHYTAERGVARDMFGKDAYIVVDDKERHDALRGVWAEDFQRGSLEEHVAPLVAEALDALFVPMEQRLRDGEVVDASAALCRDLPTYVIAAMLGIDVADRPLFARWSDAMGKAGTAPPGKGRDTHPDVLAGDEAGREMGEYLYAEIERRRAEPGPGLVSKMVHSSVGRTLTDEVIMQNVRQLLFAGNETTAKLLNNCFVVLAQHPDVRAGVSARPETLAATIEEILRWEGLVSISYRYVRGGDRELLGELLPDEAAVMSLNSAINRDPQMHERPAVFDVNRQSRMHSGFGYGMHSCLGANLARLEVRITLARAIAAIGDWELAGSVDYGTAFTLRAPHAVPIALPSAA